MGTALHLVSPRRGLFAIARPAFMLIALLGVCGAPAVAAQEADRPIAPQADGAALDVERLLANAESETVFNDPFLLRRFYALRGYRLVWAGDADAEENAAIAMRALAASENDGLNPADYTSDAALEPVLVGSSPNTPAARDLKLTDAFLRYMRDMRVGRVAPRTISPLNGLVSEAFDAAAALNEALARNTLTQLIEELPPQHAQYAQLKRALVRYRALEALGGWPTLPAQSEIVLSDAEPRVAQLRARLEIEWPELFAGPENVDLEGAVREYQRRNGLEPDGRVGPRTLAMLNVPVATRVRQIIVNMERWRWMPRAFEPRYVWINVPDASLRLVSESGTVMSSRVIVGAPATPSPLFRAEIIGVTVNPPWNVPASIARNEMLPILQSNPRYLAEHNMVLVNGPAEDPQGLAVDWAGISRNAFPYQIRQEPGPENALGALKLELPNPFSVYLHDTPAKALFARPERFFSHGCIRVENIRPLAALLLESRSVQRPNDLADAELSSDTVFLSLDAPMPVYVAYWTALENEDGFFGFRKDVYLRDASLIAVLASNPAPGFASAGDVGCHLQG